MPQFSPNKYSLLLHKAAKGDLDRLFAVDADTAGAITAFLQEAKESQSILDNMTRNGFISHEEPRFDVKEWVEQRGERRILWRVRHWSLKGEASRYRIVYAFHPIEFRYYVLAVVSRDFEYDANHEVTKRIVSVYDALNIPKY